MGARFVQDGISIDYTPHSAVTAGAVIVQEDLIGIAKIDIPANSLGALAIEGVFDFPKAAGAAAAWPQRHNKDAMATFVDSLYWAKEKMLDNTLQSTNKSNTIAYQMK